jgi:tetratricopeptide (TPR) repeat protein
MPEEASIAIQLLQQAVELDPYHFAAHAHLSWCHEWCFTRGGYVESERAAALRHACIALASDTDAASALAVAGWVVIVLTKERKTAIAAIERALSINPSCATAHYFAALTCSFDGRSQSAIAHANRALRLSPFDPSVFEDLALGVAAMAEGGFEEAAEQFATAARINPRHSLFPFSEAAALALAGRPDDAKPLVQRGLELEPSFRIQIFSEFGMSPTVAEKFIAGARLLGLPE